MYPNEQRRPPAQNQKTGSRSLDLDLRNETDLSRSHLLHRLNLLGIGWGETGENSAGKRPRFHELWNLAWEPEFEIRLIERGAWGNTLVLAAGRLLQSTLLIKQKNCLF